jgi:hypothetical protein
LDPSDWVELDEHTKASVKAVGFRAIRLTLPERLDFEDNYERTASHFRVLRDSSSGGYRVTNLRFNNIKRLSSAAALVLASEVDLWRQRVARPLRANVKTWDKSIRKILFEMGYFELLKLDLPPVKDAPTDVTFVRFIRGGTGDRDYGKLARRLREEIDAIVGSAIKKHPLYEGLSEAITNVGQHAYPAAASNAGKKQWWLSASYNKSDRHLNVMFYDRGVGIPTTLPNWGLYERVKDLFDAWTDSEKIEAATEYGRSSTFRAERGKGLQNLVEFARAYDDGSLSIYSLCGLYRVRHTRENRIVGTRRDHSTSIGGTLIEWSVKL